LGKVSSPGRDGDPIRLYGVSWTWFAEDYSRVDGAPLIFDWHERLEEFGGSKFYGTNADGMSPLYPTSTTMKYNREVGRVTPRMARQDGSLCGVAIRVVGPEGRRLAGAGGETFVDSGFSAAVDPRTGTPFVEFPSATAVSYEVRFRPQGLSSRSILLAAPVFDDITFYFSSGGADLLEYRASFSAGEGT